MNTPEENLMKAVLIQAMKDFRDGIELDDYFLVEVPYGKYHTVERSYTIDGVEEEIISNQIEDPMVYTVAECRLDSEALRVYDWVEKRTGTFELVAHAFDSTQDALYDMVMGKLKRMMNGEELKSF